MTYDSNNFQKDVIERSHEIPVLVDFWAEWCGPCKVLGPVLEKLAPEHAGRWELVKIDTEAHPQLAKQYQIRSIPNVKLFSDGEMIDEFVGALPEHAILQWLEKALPGENRKLIGQAQQLLAEGKIDEAKKMLEAILVAEPENHQVRVLLARHSFYEDPGKAVSLVEGIHEDSEFFDMAQTIRVLGKLMQLSDTPEALPEGPVKAHYLDAIVHLRNSDFDKALENFIDVIQNDRYYDDDGSRKACIAIFKFLGEQHEITRKHRPAFSSALYV